MPGTTGKSQPGGAPNPPPDALSSSWARPFFTPDPSSAHAPLRVVARTLCFLFPQPHVLQECLGLLSAGHCCPGSRRGALWQVSDDRCPLRAPATLTPVPPSPTWNRLPTHMPGRARTAPRPSIPEPTTDASRGCRGRRGEGTSEPARWLGPQGSVACASPPGKGGCYFFSKKHKSLDALLHKKGGPVPSVGAPPAAPPACPHHSTCPGQQGASGSAELRDTFLPVPPPTSLFLGGKRECPWTARLRAIWPRQSLGVRSSWPWAEALPRSPVPTSRARLPGTS